MKITKLILTLSALVFCIDAMGANMCIKNDVMMVILDPVVNGSSLSSNATGKTWSTSFNYGVISGIGACGGESVSTGAVATNQNALSPTSAGKYCFCKMLRPAVSQWVYSGINGASNCASHCASYCASYVGSTVAVRQGLFSSVGI